MMKNISKNLLYIGLGALLSLTLISAFAMDSVPLLPQDQASNSEVYLSSEAAISIALTKAGEGFEVQSIKFEIDDDEGAEYKLKLISSTATISATLNALDGIINQWKLETVQVILNDSYITEEEARQIALEKVGEGFTIVSVEFDHDDDDDVEYEIKLVSAEKKVEIEIDAITGKITEYEVEMIQTSSTKPEVPINTYITKEQAIQIALDAVGSGYQVVDVEFDDDEFEIELTSDEYKVEIEIDAKTGKVVELEKEYIGKPMQTTTYITRERAIEIARTKVGNARLKEIEFEDDDVPPYYELEFEDDRYEYEIKIHAITGMILEFEIDD